MLVFYEMDLGLNHVVRKYSTPVDNSAHLLIAVPGEPYGPSGIIVVCENMISYKKVDHDERDCAIPVRNDSSQRGTFFTCHSTYTSKELFFFLLSNEYGDIFKISLDFTNSQVHGINVQYFDTTTPNVCMNILRPGYLFCAAEYSNHTLYSFLDIGENDPNPIRTLSANKQGNELVTFNPRDFINLQAVDEFQNLASINDMKVEDLTGEGNPQIYLACGRGAQGCLRVLRHGLTVIEMAVTGMP